MKKALVFLTLIVVVLMCFVSCNKEKPQNPTPEHTHNFEEWSVTKSPTCTEDGVKTRYCDCGEKQSDTIPATGHKEETLSSKDATCTETGLTEGTRCSNCSETFVAQSKTPMLAHTYDDDNDAKCNVCGFERLINCKHDNPEKIEIIPATQATCTSTGLTEGLRCALCGTMVVPQTISQVIDCVEGEWIIDCQPTTTEDGKRHTECTMCGKVMQEEILRDSFVEKLFEVMPNANGFENVDISEHVLPTTVVDAKRETSGMGYVIKLETEGYARGMVIVVGVDTNGCVTGATCIASNETFSVEYTYGASFIGKDADTTQEVDLVGGATKTTSAYKSAVSDAIVSALILCGETIDLRTEEQMHADNLNAVLPSGEGIFTRMFMAEVVDSVDKVYVADNGTGYVLVIGDKFVGVGADGKATNVVSSNTTPVTNGIDELKAIAEAAIAIVSTTEIIDIDISEYTNSSDRNIARIFRSIVSVDKTATGNYVFTIEADGQGTNAEFGGSGKRFVMKVSISADGRIIDAQTVEHYETANWGGLELEDGAYNSNFIGKDQSEAGGVDIIAGTTLTTRGYKNAILRCFEAFTIIEANDSL